MDISTIGRLEVYRDEKFRAPSPIERRIGLWVDRIGASVSRERPRSLRILGQYAAVYVRAGAGRFISDTAGRLRVHPGTAMLLFPEEPCMYFPETQWDTLWVVWNGGEAARLEAMGYLSPRRPVVRDPRCGVAQAHAALGELMGVEGLAAVLRRKMVVLNMIHDLYTGHGPAQGRTDERLEAALRCIDEELAQPLNAADLARRFHLSPTHFRRLFREHTGMGPREFITARRVALAKEHLSRGATIKQAARLAGFDDVFYFMRVFRKVAGVTAGRFAAMGR
ncbi:MAG TPA: AraC family transcriptional regulator [Candidatus Brocadiia bacterium]|nr:AraC family transcriptional regulator [Candidatus Brocadiia bacterium]